MEGHLSKFLQAMKKTVLHQIHQQSSLALLLRVTPILIISIITFLWHLGSIGLVDETEPLFAEAARQMLETGNWITPYFNGETRFDKPPLIYWLIAVGYQLLGVNEWAVRLPSALSAMGLTLFLFFVVNRYGRSPISSTPQLTQLRWSSFISAIALALAPLYFLWARVGVSDLLLTGCMGGSLLCFFMGYVHSQQESPPPFFRLGIPRDWYLGFYILTALAVLTKGPIGMVLPGFIILAFLFYQGNSWQVLKEMRLLSGIIIFLVITVPWHVLIIAENGQAYIDSFFGYHNVERFTDVVNDHSGPWYYYFLILLIGFAPLSIYLPSAIAQLKIWRRRFWCRQPRQEQFASFSFFWFIIIFGFFSIAVTKLPHYIIPSLPAAAALVGFYWSHYQQQSLSREFIITVGINIIFLLSLAVTFYFIPDLIGYDPAAPNLGDAYEATGLHWVGTSIWLIAAILLILGLIWKQYRRWLWGVNLGAMLLTFIFVLQPTFFLIDELRQQPLRELAQLEPQVRQGGEELIMIGMKKPSVVFYRQKNLEFFSDENSAIGYLMQQHPNESTLILTHPDKLKELRNHANEITALETKGAYALARFEPNFSQ